MYVVTGAAGFIGSNLVKALNERGITEILAVDDLKDGAKFVNLADCDIAEYLDKDEFLERLEDGDFDGQLSAVLHQGACSDTTETDGRYMMDANYGYSRRLLDWCIGDEVHLIYASSAAIYGAGREFREERECEAPLNIYGYSKFLFDQLVRRRYEERTAQIAGLRYFNVYGEREAHKGRMASVAHHFFHQYRGAGHVRLFTGSKDARDMMRYYWETMDACVPPAAVVRIENGWVSPSYGVKRGTSVIVVEATAPVPMSAVYLFTDTPLEAAERARWSVFPGDAA